MTEAVLPNLVVIGPPKCGTSSLFRWLTLHPDVCGSLRKEPFFLMDAESPLRATAGFLERGLEGYRKCFPRDADEYPVRIEATTHYLYQDTALRQLAALPECHVCVVLRDPAERVLSSFAYTQNNQSSVPASVTFEHYIDRVFRDMPLYPDVCRSVSSAYVLERDISYGEYSRFLTRWIERLGRERVHWVLFEDLKARPREVVKRLLHPFALDARLYDEFDFAKRNETYRVKYQSLHRVARFVNCAIGGGWDEHSLMRRLYLRLQKRLPDRVANMDIDAGLERLRIHYAPHNRELEDLLSTDLAAWMPLSSNNA